MRPKLRRSQLVSIWGPGALVDLPNDAVIDDHGEAGVQV